jgi:hypothetical protein
MKPRAGWPGALLQYILQNKPMVYQCRKREQVDRAKSDTSSCERKDPECKNAAEKKRRAREAAGRRTKSRGTQRREKNSSEHDADLQVND